MSLLSRATRTLRNVGAYGGGRSYSRRERVKWRLRRRSYHMRKRGRILQRREMR